MYARLQARHSVDQFGIFAGARRRPVADHERKLGIIFADIVGDDDPVMVDERDLVVMLPDRKGVALIDRDLERIWIELLDGHLFDPGQRRNARTPRFDVEGDKRWELADPESVDDVDLGGLTLSGDLDLLDGETGPGGDRGNDGHGVSA